MKTSVVIATFNGSRYIIEQLTSIIQQSVLPSEIVISDDGSSDSTIDLIHSFIRQHESLPIQYKLVVNNSGNHGVLGNFENAVLNASGDYVFFCDQDDIWFEKKIERLVGVLDICNEQVVIHNAQVIRECDDGSFKPIDKHLLGKYPFDSAGLYKINGSEQVKLAFYNCLIHGMCTCIKRNYLLTLLPFSRGSNHDNWILFCALADDTILAVSDDLAYYRIHENNTCGIQEYKKKRSLSKRLASFDQQSKLSILNQYVWYKDSSSYLGNRTISDDKTQLLISFFSQRRILAVSSGKTNAVFQLFKAYREGAYEIDGTVVFLHDLEFVLLHSRKNRKQFLSALGEYLREYKSGVC